MFCHRQNVAFLAKWAIKGLHNNEYIFGNYFDELYLP